MSGSDSGQNEPRRAIALGVEYDGTAYCGWQRQAGSPTVQQVLEEALESMTGAPVRVTAAGRTDSGVHARGQVARFLTDKSWPAVAFRGGLNARLPEDVGIRAAWEAPPDFDPRRDAIRRIYTYRLDNRRVRPVLDRRIWTHYPAPLDFDRIRSAAECLRGDHDFSGFRSVMCGATRTRLDLERIEWESVGPGRWIMSIACRSFLHNMVRIIVGTLIEVGRGAFDEERIREILESGDRSLAGPTARPEGLCLERVDYPESAGVPTDWNDFDVQVRP